jgi:hypothetical protein
MAAAMRKLVALLERLTSAAERQAQAGERIAGALETIAHSPEWKSVAASVARLTDHLTPDAPAVVGTPYVAGRLGCTTVWVAEMVRLGQIPGGCLVPGTGGGKPWKFHRAKIDDWLASR